MANYNPLEWPLGIPVFRSELIGENEIRWENETLVIGRNVDMQALAFDLNLTDEDRDLLHQCKVKL